ncbi:MBL fold metallo-hydrolase, partial [Streptomyces griseorubiginosus]|nr:MBL fold metallo-hydrolase [Streptomyces griseorubiginosus]
MGAAHPRQEGPTDLRLVPPALATWATAALTLDAPPGWVTGIAVFCLGAAGLLLAGRRVVAGDRTGRGAWPRGAWSRTSLAALLLCVAAAAVSAGLHGADVRRGPVPELARRYATVTAEVEVTSDPRVTRPRVRGDHAAPASVLVEAEVRRVEEADGTVVTTRAPVLMIVNAASRGAKAGRAEADGAAAGRAAVGRAEAGTAPSVEGRSRSPWLELLPSTRVRVVARVVPALVGGDRVAGVLRVRGKGVP